MSINFTVLLIGLLCAGGLALVAVVAVIIAAQNRQADQEAGAPQNDPAPPPKPVGFSSSDSPDLTRRAEAMLRAGDKAGAVRLYQDSAGLGLRDASDAVEKIEKQIYREQFVRADPKLKAQLIALLKQGRKIDAIRLYGAANQVGLVEAMKAVEALDNSLQND